MTKSLTRKLLLILLAAVLVSSLFTIAACNFSSSPKLMAQFDDSHLVYDTDSLDSLMPYFTVTYTDENGNSTQVTDFELIGDLQVGSSKIVVSYQNLTAIVTINVLKDNTVDTDNPKAAAKLTATFDSTRTVYEGDSLTSLKPYFTVTYTDEDGSTSRVYSYTLIGSLNVGENQIVVLYNDLTVILTVNVVEKPTVTFVADGQIVAVLPYTKYNLSVTNPAIPDKLGYDGAWEDYTLSADSGNITVNAIYTAQNYTVKFDYNGADGNTDVQSMTVTYGQPIGTLPEPTFTDCIFIGWYYNYTYINSGDVWSRAYGCTLVAKWKPTPYDSNGLTYSLNADNESYSVNGWGDMISSELTIPETHLGMPVTAIYANAFRNCSVLTSIVIPDSVTEIGNYAFYGCDQLVNIDLGNGVITIGHNAFTDCVNLISLTIPASVESIGEAILSNCSSLESITVEQGNSFYVSSGNCLIATERGWLISGCKNSVIPTDGSVKVINDYAFDGCRDLEEINIPDSVTRIGRVAFRNCVKLKSVVIPDSVTSNLLRDTFSGCIALENISLSNNIFLIQDAFGDCISLRSITIPQGVRYIVSSRAFAGCINLESVTILNRENQLVFAGDMFKDCAKLSSIYFEGTEEEWNSLVIFSSDASIGNATVYFYSESAPELNEDGTDYDGNFWHWDQDIPTVWKKEN